MWIITFSQPGKYAAPKTQYNCAVKLGYFMANVLFDPFFSNSPSIFNFEYRYAINYFSLPSELLYAVINIQIPEQNICNALIMWRDE